ncbi:MAG: 16S rRNA (adenine(1518)-N(6)/adenine(1519)-N(6))-dimethyltransferase, partial [Bifidobacteriaceae bacterium]|nr:16S rRNA (adenine(1518)-N(6)/adenine(1519)-N(6))-dimethyltransferase [Bifidobacteriaceae bacterium]
MTSDLSLLTPSDVRDLTRQLGLTPSKAWGQNFVVDPGTVRRIAARAPFQPGDQVVEIGPGLGSLTLALLEAGAQVTAIEIDPVLAGALPATVAEHAPAVAERLQVLTTDALSLTELPSPQPSALVANLPYSVSTKVLLSFLERFESIRAGLVMVQSEVAARLVAGPGSRTYGVPSVKLAWFAEA